MTVPHNPVAPAPFVTIPLATAAPVAGVKPPYIAAQLGHTNTKMLFEKYARWINAADKGNERRALEAAFQQQPAERVAVGG